MGEILALIGLLTVIALVGAISFNLCSPAVALIAFPVAAALCAGFGLDTLKFMTSGIAAMAPIVAMFVFAILYFGIMTDAGLLDPLVRTTLKAIGVSPTRLVVATALLALLVHLDGSGAVCFLVVIPTLLPLYDTLGVDRRVLACAASMAAGVNFLPWTGPTLRAAAALHLTPAQIFQPMIGVQLIGLAFVFAMALLLGARAGRSAAGSGVVVAAPRHVLSEDEIALRRPARFWINLVLTVLVLGAMISGLVPPAIAFMLGVAAALTLNYPRPAEQRARLEAHARAALTMAVVLFAAGVFTGIMTGSGMLKAMAGVASGLVPHHGGSHIPFALSLIAMPLSLLFDPDSFYFGLLPVVAEVHRSLGGQPVQVAQAALIGQMTTGFPVSPLTPATFLVAGLSRIELSAHQRFTAPFLFAASLVMAAACVLFGLFPV